MTLTGSEPWLPRGVFGPIFHLDAIATIRSASARISTVLGIWSSGSSIRSSRDTVAEIVDDLEARDVDLTAPAPQESPAGSLPLPVEEKAQLEPQVPKEWREAQRVLCIPGLGQLDEAVALIVTQLVAKQGIRARAEGSGALSISRIFSLETDDVAVVCICYIENATPAQIRYATRRLRRKVPNALVITALVGKTDAVGNTEELFGEGSEPLQRSLEGTVNRIREIATNSRRIPQLSAA